jgi:hypothetical protein
MDVACRPRPFALSVERELLGQCGGGARLANGAERPHRRVAHLGLRIVDRLDQGVSGFADLQACDDASRRLADGRIVVVERLGQALALLSRQRCLRDHAGGIDRFEADLCILVVHRLEEGRHQFSGHRPRPDGERPQIERRRRDRALPLLHDEANHLLRLHVLFEEERQLRRDGLQLDIVDRVEYQRRHRRDCLRVLRVAQQPDGAQPRVRVRIPQVANHVVEPERLRRDCGGEKQSRRR